MPITRRTTFAASMGAGLAAALSPSGAGAQPAQSAPTSAQAPAFYRYKVGDITVTAVNDGIAGRPLETMAA